MLPHIVRIWLQYTAALLAVFEMSMEHQDMFDMLVIIQHMVEGRAGVNEDKIKVKIKVKFILEQAMKSQRGVEV